ncbi:MAG TPA: valine--tRNA ligase [Tepidisphaeraceae bacterium]|nr:valine--tRNA ligase [Tepidisphaeraceae bacterium]
MNTELSPKYDPSAVETQAYRVWMEEGCFHADPARPGEAYSIVIPPPNVTGALHLGHAINATLQDILVRQHRMRGFNTLWIPGIDHAGIATQAVVEKQLKEQENKTRHDVGREGLVERIWKWKEQYGSRILEQLKRIGASCDWERTRFTLDDMCARAVRETFFKLFRDGLIYRGKRLVNWDTFLQTSISDDEIYHETVKTNLWHIRYEIVGKGAECAESAESTETTENKAGDERNSHETEQKPNLAKKDFSAPSAASALSAQSSNLEGELSSSRPSHMVVATTRPETLLADTAVAVHSQDARWNWAIGKSVRLPLTGRLIPIIADDILVDPKFGTGVVKVTPAHDPNDYAVWQRHQGQADAIDIFNLLTPDGRINSERPEWGKYAGLKRDAASKLVVEDLKSAGLLEKEEPYETQVGHSDRSKTPIEPYLSDQWFVKMAPLAEPALQAVREGKIKFHPERHAQQYLSWLGEKRDWPVSRQLWWGHRIPVWTKEVEAGDEFKKGATARRGKAAILQAKHGDVLEENGQVWGFARGLFSTETGKGYHAIALQGLDAETERILESDGYIQDPDVLDTWFSSALWPHSTLGWPQLTAELAKYYPTSVLVTGRDIITLWVARMVMMGMYNMGAANATTDDAGRITGVSPVQGARGVEEPRVAKDQSNPHGRDARDTVKGGTALNTTANFEIAESAPRGTMDDAGRITGVSPVPGARGVEESRLPNHQSNPHGRDARDTAEGARATASRLGLPFLDVAINPTILDGKGERMSKSKGNGVDPVDIIDSYGADALRFTLTKMATETQDARMPVKRDAAGRNTSEKFDEGRNFCNKLWNACRFALSNLENVRPTEDGATASNSSCKMDGATGSLADRWIVSRFNHAVGECDQALAAYRFDAYAKACYDFFWRDFCDWYVEAIKPAMKDPARAGQTGQVLATVLDGALRLMHPMVPFITETVWWRLNDVRPTRGLPSRLECTASPRLVLAAWPKLGPRDEAAERVFPKLQEIISAIRTLRNDHKVNTRQVVVVHFKADDDFSRDMEANREMIELLATCTLRAISADAAKIPNAAVASAGGCEIFVEGLIDPNAQKQRLAREVEEKTRLVDSLTSRLDNPAYTAKAPAQLVQQTRAQLTAAQADLAKAMEAIREL